MAEDKKPRKPGTGAAFTNKYKTEDWHPEWTGEFADLNGNLYDLRIKEKIGQHSGQPYREVVIKVKTEKAKPSNASPNPIHDMIDDIPF